MIPARSLARSGLPRATARTCRATKPQTRFQSSTTSSSANTSAGSSHIGAGVAGGLAAATVLYGVYYVSPAGKMSRGVNKTVKEANNKYQAAAQQLQQNTPSADEAIEYVKNFCYSYVAWIPGGRHYVDLAFKDIETVRKNNREEADKLVNDAYKQFQDLSKSGLSMETASKAAEVLADLSKKLGNLAGNAFEDIIENHPELKEKFGGSVDQLKKLGDQYGPEAKKQVDETWNQVRDVLSGGLTAANINKVRQLVQEKVEQVQKFGDEAWKKGLEQAKPYLDKNPKVKELIENNADALKSGNAKELFDKVKTAVEKGDIGDLEGYVNKAVDQAKEKGSQVGKAYGLDQYLDQIPNGSEILSKLKQLKDVADKHSEEGKKLFEETLTEVKKVLEKKSEKAQEIAEKAKKESK
ncbi:hypothetical protein BKA67DRAFT_581979 [Truncatella angustata]|uniref:Uncharacterized protein n=1 Tax=Truncatella angustata TaxID=152316 RepID=A0A9P8RJW7_9PEZI|nr:uncharacterized protein BKA67DRAFT_581979 [Truncatella angustata]KAH6647217.1 hypothetical protein BKA67DRAFT_581979 [Truncatella angustata]KAH8201494.1 hypothetical protein TruAng_004342 [Truncatella angustata]